MRLREFYGDNLEKMASLFKTGTDERDLRSLFQPHMTTLTVTPVQKWRSFRLNRPRHEGRLQYKMRDWHLREMKRRGDVAYTRPQLEVMYEPMERVWFLYVSWHEAELPAGSGMFHVPEPVTSIEVAQTR